YLDEDPDGQSDLFSSGHRSGEEGNELPAPPKFSCLKDSETRYKAICTVSELQEVVERLSGTELLCFDTETNSSDPMLADLTGISLSIQSGEAWYIPVDMEGTLSTGVVLPLLEPVFMNETIAKVAHNAKFDELVLNRAGMAIEGLCYDTMVAAYLIDAGQSLKMDEVARTWLGYDPVPITDLIGTGRNQKRMDEIPWEGVVDYACEDADITLQIWNVLKERLKEDDLLEIAEKIEFPLIRVLSRMEKTGIRVDREMLKRFSSELNSDMLELQKRIYELAGEEFNLNSPRQLADILFEKLEIPPKRKTKTGQYSTAENVLLDLATDHEVPALVLDYRSLTKLKSTYADAIPKLIHPESGRVHTSFNQTVAATGRLSSSSPNLQNIPIRTKRGREIRKAFVPDEGFTLLAADYSQIELRVIASMSGDRSMIDAFHQGQDIHARAAVEIFGLSDVDEVTPDQRRKAKEVNFGIPYGVSAYGLASRLGISNSEGKEMIDRYFERFPGIETFMKSTVEFAREHRYVKTLLGRRRYIPDIDSRNRNIRSFAERTAINMPVQGTAADIIKLAMIRIDEWLIREGIKSRMLLQVHDELVFEIHEDEQTVVPDKISEMMESAMVLDVPLTVEMGIGSNWLEAH
ncbi:MAG: DNA polymerase I, partial [Balneolaceae bacterium]